MPTFEYLRSQVQYLRWQFPSRLPWLAKTPSHFGCEAMLVKAFKKPRFIVTHRDPVKCVPSITLTSLAQRKLYSDYDSTSMLGPDMLAMFAGAASQHMAWRDANPQIEVLDLGFHEITRDGVAAARKVFEFAGIPFTAAAEQAVRAWERDHPKDMHGKAVYSAASMGCSDEQIATAFAEYRRRFAQYL
jgi:hypothetical protein